MSMWYFFINDSVILMTHIDAAMSGYFNQARYFQVKTDVTTISQISVCSKRVPRPLIQIPPL